MQENRRLSRWRINKHIRLKLFDTQVYTVAFLRNVNLRGIQILSDIKLVANSIVKLNIELSEDTIIEVEVWVVWDRALNGINHYGLYFTKIRDADKENIYQFARNKFPSQVNQSWWPDKFEEANNMMNKETSEDKRIFARFKVDFPLRFLASAFSNEKNARSVDISAKGIGFVSEERLPTHEPLELWLDLSDNAEPIYLRGNVVWSTPFGNNNYRSGINLEKADLMGLARVLRAKG